MKMRVKERFKRYLAMLLAFTMIMSSSSMNVLAAGVVGGYTKNPGKTDETDVRKNVVTFRTDDYSSVHIDGYAAEGGIGYAEDGVISFTVAAEDGYEVESIIVDESIPLTAQDGIYTIHNIQTDNTTVDVTTKAVETEAVSENETDTAENSEEYALSIRHLLVTDAGLYEKTEEIQLEEQDFKDGKYDVLQNEYKREGIRLSTSSCEVTTEDFTDHKASVELEYELADGYVVIADSVASTFAVYTGDLDDVIIVPEGQIPFTVNFINEDGTIYSEAHSEGILQQSNGTYMIDYFIEDVPDGYTLRLDESLTVIDGAAASDEITLDGNEISSILSSGVTAVSVTVVYQADTVDYTVKSVFEALEGAEPEIKTEIRQGKVDTLTEVEADPKVVGFTAEPIDQKVISADKSTIVEIQYLRNEYTIKYDTKGGSYVKAKTGKYEEEVPVYSSTESTHLTCTREEHTHSAFPTETASRRNNGKTIGCYTCRYNLWAVRYEWQLSCGKAEHTHTAECYGSSSTYDVLPTRQGYEFGGWYTDEACEKKAEQSITFNDETVAALKDNTYTVYAKWIPKEVVYRVVYMKQVWDNSINAPYDAFVSSEVRYAKVNSSVSAGAGSGISAEYCTYNPERSTTATVKADGSTVVYAYYDLNLYTFKFNLNNKDATLTMGDKTYKNDQYEVKAVFGQDISAKWPTSANVKLSNSEAVFYKWHPDNGSVDWVTKRFEVSKEMLPNNGGTVVNLTAIYDWNLKPKAVEYWLQSEDGKSYIKNERYSQEFNTNENLQAKDLYGFTRYSGTPSGYKASDSKTYRFYYTRNKESITYMYGSKELKEIKDIYFGADISGDKYTKAPTNEECGVDKEYTFAGWYDNAELEGEPYNFTVMPGNDLVLYAKWQAPEKTVTLKFQDERPDGKITVLKGDVAEIPLPEREGYVFGGWYQEADCTTEFDAMAPVTADKTIFAKWIPNKNTTYIVKHIEKDTDRCFAEAGPKTGRTGSAVVEKAVSHPGYVAESNTKSIILQQEPSKNVIQIYYAPLSELTYKVQYVYNGEPVKTVDGTKNLISFREYPDQDIARELLEDGYTINERYKDVTLVPGENIVQFTLKIKSYTITYILNGGADPGNPLEYTKNDLPITLKNPTREGYEFAGWTTTNTYTGEHNPMNVVLEEGTKGNLTFTATWKPIINVESYKGVYDGQPHSVKVTGAPAGSTISYSTDEVDWDTDIKKVSYTDVINGQIVYVKATGTDLVDSDVKEGTVTITPKPLTITAKSHEDITYDGNAHKVGGYTNEGLVATETISGIKAEREETEVGTYTTTVAERDKLKITKTDGADSTRNYEVKYNDGSFKIVKAAIDEYVTLKTTDVEEIYDGAAHSAGTATAVSSTGDTNLKIEYSKDGIDWTDDPAEIIAVDVADSIEAVKVRVSGDNYEGYVKGTEKLIIKKREVTITANDRTAEYTGKSIGAESDNAYTVENLVEGHLVHVEKISGEATLVGEYPEKLVPENVTITLDASAAKNSRLRAVALPYDVTDNYQINIVKGKLTITGNPVKPDTTLEVKKTSDVAEGATVSLNQTITYTITVANKGNLPYKNVVVRDEMEDLTITNATMGMIDGQTVTIRELPVGETVTITATHVVTEADILAGRAVNVVTAKGDPIPDPDNPDQPKIPEDEDMKEDPTDDKASVLSVNKELMNPEEQIDGKYLIGATVKYNITIKNTGNLTLKDIKVNDVLTASEGTPAGIVVLTAGDGYTVTGTQIQIASLAPNAQIVVPAAYVVQKDDASKTLTNVAAGTAVTTDPRNPTTITDSSDPVPVVIEDAPGEEYVYEGKITVYKSVTKAGKAAKVNDTIYVALFDAAGNMVKDTKPQAIVLANSANGETTFVNLPVDNAVYKVVEVNESGEPVEPNTDDFDYSKVLYSNQTITLTESSTSATVSVENQIGEDGNEKETSKDDDSKKTTGSSTTSGKVARTGDDTNMMLYWLILAMAIAVMGGTFVYRRKRRR